MTIGKAKKEYNRLLKRFNNAWNWFDREDIPMERKEEFLGEYEKILNGLNYYLSKIEVYTNQEVLGGFKIATDTDMIIETMDIVRTLKINQ